MTGQTPYVVVLAAAAGRVGRSTLAANLAVYLKGLDEDLPVALLSFDSGHDPAATFALPGVPAADCRQLFSGAVLEEQLSIGQFGVEYLAATGGLPPVDAGRLRALLRTSHYPGVLVIDAGPLHDSPAAAALRAADLVLTPLRDAAGLAALATVRRELKAGGGHEGMLWLVPAMVEDPQQQARQLKLLRFAARERGCQVLDDEFVVDARLPQATRGVGGSVLTRLPDSRAHELLHRLARLVLQQSQQGQDSACHLQRLRLDDALPSRFRRVEVVCPLCGGLACFDSAHYCESLPQRRRWLLHDTCFSALMSGHELAPFWNAGRSAVLRTGVEDSARRSQLRLLLPDADGLHFESGLFRSRDDDGWRVLVRHATGRTLDEQFPALLMIYPAVSGPRLLSEHWYRSCAALRRRLRKGLAAEL